SMMRFFLQAEDGIRDRNVTGVQTCALPILDPELSQPLARAVDKWNASRDMTIPQEASGAKSSAPGEFRELLLEEGVEPHRISSKIGRASCREREGIWEGEAAGRRRTRGQRT